MAEQKRLREEEEEREREERERRARAKEEEGEEERGRVEKSEIDGNQGAGLLQDEGEGEEEEEGVGAGKDEGGKLPGLSLKDSPPTGAVNGTPKHKKSLPVSGIWHLTCPRVLFLNVFPARRVRLPGVSTVRTFHRLVSVDSIVGGSGGRGEMGA